MKIDILGNEEAHWAGLGKMMDDRAKSIFINCV